MFFVFVSMVLRVGERVDDFFIVHTNEEICDIHIELLYFIQIPLCMHFIKIYKIKYYLNLFIISKVFNCTINENI